MVRGGGDGMRTLAAFSEVSTPTCFGVFGTALGLTLATLVWLMPERSQH